MAIRDLLRKAASLIVEKQAEEQPVPPIGGGDLGTASSELNSLLADLEGGPPPAGGKTVEQIVRAADGPNLDQVKVAAAAGAPELTPDGKLDYAAIYAKASLPAAPFSAEQMLAMITDLPENLPLDTKRQTVKVTLGALGQSIGANPETIVADASRKLAALASYLESLTHQTSDFVAKAELEIAALQAQMEEKRTAIQDARQRLAQVNTLCETETDRLDDVLEFFSLDVPPSKYAPPP